MGKKVITVDDYFNGVIQSDRVTLSKAITLIESGKPEDKESAIDLVSKCLPHAGKSIRIGITGTPGVGKSTFIESFGQYLVEQGKKVAVLAVDPSSTLSKGSILGDKTRMTKLAVHENAFIRPSASRGVLGGVALSTRDTIILCEAAGYDIILIETVGVGQSETIVHSITDFFMLLTLSGGGDELQGIKRGIMEMADLIVINKVEDHNLENAKILKNQLINALSLFTIGADEWQTKVEMCSAITGKGIEAVWKTVENYIRLTKTNSSFDEKRKKQRIDAFRELSGQQFMHFVHQNEDFKNLVTKIEHDIVTEKLSVHAAIRELISRITITIKSS